MPTASHICMSAFAHRAGFKRLFLRGQPVRSFAWISTAPHVSLALMELLGLMPFSAPAHISFPVAPPSIPLLDKALAELLRRQGREFTHLSDHAVCVKMNGDHRFWGEEEQCWRRSPKQNANGERIKRQ